MNHRITIIICSLLLVAFVTPMAQAANPPYTVYGLVSYEGTGIDGIQVTIWNSNTNEMISYVDYETLTTWTGVSGPGYYSGNIGNMPTAWSRGDIVYVNATYLGTTLSESFTIPDSGYIYEVDLSFSAGTSSGGQESEGTSQWHSVPGLSEIIEWIRSINTTDFAIVLVLALVLAGLLVSISSRKGKRRPLRRY
jgi:hypothetical protein